MTARRYLPWVVMTLLVLACVAPVWAVAPAPGHDTPVLTVMTTKPAKKAVMTAHVIAFESLHVRKTPGHDSLVLGYLYHDNTVVMTGQCSEEPKGWAQIEWEGATAWVRAKYLSDNSCEE